MSDAPEIVVVKDYDGYFEGLVRNWVRIKVEAKRTFRHKKITISSGPYRQDAVSYRITDGVLNLDFYSALRAGFGHLSDEDVEQIITLL